MKDITYCYTVCAHLTDHGHVPRVMDCLRDFSVAVIDKSENRRWISGTGLCEKRQSYILKPVSASAAGILDFYHES